MASPGGADTCLLLTSRLQVLVLSHRLSRVPGPHTARPRVPTLRCSPCFPECPGLWLEGPGPGSPPPASSPCLAHGGWLAGWLPATLGAHGDRARDVSETFKLPRGSTPCVAWRSPQQMLSETKPHSYLAPLEEASSWCNSDTAASGQTATPQLGAETIPDGLRFCSSCRCRVLPHPAAPSADSQRPALTPWQGCGLRPPVGSLEPRALVTNALATQAQVKVKAQAVPLAPPADPGAPRRDVQQQTRGHCFTVRTKPCF